MYLFFPINSEKKILLFFVLTHNRNKLQQSLFIVYASSFIADKIHSLKCSLWFRARRITGILNRSGLVPISDLAGPYLVPISEKSGPYLVPIRDFFQYAWSCHHWGHLHLHFHKVPGHTFKLVSSF